jgi:DNA-binding Lrp family transcriptional regulator
MYNGGCRCDACRRANAEYTALRKAERGRGNANKVIDATPAREHIRRLQRAGVGYRAIADVTSLTHRIVLGIKLGRRLKAREQTVKKILRVNVECRADGAHVSARSTWLRIQKLCEEGYSKKELAKLLDYKMPNLQLRKNKVTVRNRARVERLFEKLTT